MERSSLKTHQILSLSKTEDNTYKIIEKNHFIGKLTFMLFDESIAIFDNKTEKFTFKQIGFWKPIIRVCYLGESNILFTVSCNLLKNNTVNILSYGTQNTMRHIYWECHHEFTEETIISYSQFIGSRNPIIVKISAPQKMQQELNILPALGCFFLLNYERLTKNQIPQLRQVNQLSGSI